MFPLQVVCDKCSNYRTQLAYLGNEVKRICVACSQKIMSGKSQVDSPKSQQLDIHYKQVQAVQASVRTRDTNSKPGQWPATLLCHLLWSPSGWWLHNFIVISFRVILWPFGHYRRFTAITFICCIEAPSLQNSQRQIMTTENAVKDVIVVKFCISCCKIWIFVVKFPCSL